jgi:hypothetical protein
MDFGILEALADDGLMIADKLRYLARAEPVVDLRPDEQHAKEYDRNCEQSNEP